MSRTRPCRPTQREAEFHDRPGRPPPVRARRRILPGARWELIAQTEYYGADAADAATLREPRQLEQRSHASLTDITDITDTINRFHCRPIERFASGGASQRRDLR